MVWLTIFQLYYMQNDAHSVENTCQALIFSWARDMLSNILCVMIDRGRRLQAAGPSQPGDLQGHSGNYSTVWHSYSVWQAQSIKMPFPPALTISDIMVSLLNFLLVSLLP
jgi:hypothetical protein